MTILVTGAAGYLGSHVCLELLESGHQVVGVDNLDNGSAVAIDRVEALAGAKMALFETDLRDRNALRSIFESHDVTDVMHLAGLKAVAESVTDPLRYYDTNVGSTISLLDAMVAHDVNRLVFSSSCTVYGDPSPDDMPMRESASTDATNPYGRTKLVIEELLRDVSSAATDFAVVSLRYFNPIGAHPSGQIGEDPRGVPNNLLPFITQVAVGRRDRLEVFGGDYPTPDGTCIRDYIHVMDLARGHVAALDVLRAPNIGFDAINLGTGTGSSVLEVLTAAEAAIGRPIPYDVVDRRPGDAAAVYADASYAENRLGWRAKHDLHEMCADHWNWQRKNPDGYR